MAEPLVSLHIQGFQELFAGIRKATQDLSKETRQANLAVSKQVVEWAQSAARQGTRLEQRAAVGIGPSATNRTARIRMIPAQNGTDAALAAPAFWGMKKRVGWFGGWSNGKKDAAMLRRFAGLPTQMPPWVGNSWIAGRPGEGPYVINEVLGERIAEIEAMYADAYEKALQGAFPGGFE